MRVDINPTVWVDIRNTGTGDAVRVLVCEAGRTCGPYYYPSRQSALAALNDAQRSTGKQPSQVAGFLAWCVLGVIGAVVVGAIAHMPLLTVICFSVFLWYLL